MTVNTKEVEGRRTLRFDSLDEVVADVEVLRAHGYEQVGNWSLGQVCEHLAKGVHMSIDGVDFKVPWPMRLAGRLMRGWMLRRGFPAGLPLKGAASALRPADVSDEEGVDALHRAIARLKTQSGSQPSPVLGRMSPAQWDEFHRRHAELHLSFLRPQATQDDA